MHLQRLHYFSVLATFLNYSRAADSLFISQPTLSKQIALLEEELGMKLFLRNKRSVQLTEDGRICLGKARNILDGCRDLEDWASAVSHKTQPALHFGYYGLLMNDLVPMILQNMWKTCPSAELSLRLLGINNIIPTLMNGQLDAAIITTTYFTKPAHICSQKICTIDYKLVVPANHRLAQRSKVDIGELANEKFILFSKENFPQTYNTTVELCEKYGLTPNIAYECEDPLTLYLMIESGKCITIASARRPALRAYDVKLIDLNCAAEDLKKEILVIWNKENKNPHINHLIQAINSTFLSLNKENEISLG